MTKKAWTSLFFAAALIVFGVTAASAQTPDELPPALETVCDMETGAAFGWCNAYCEAMDCEVDNTHASPTACGKVRTKFQQNTGRDLPCEVSCPCTDFVGSFWSDAVSGAVTLDACGRDADACIALGRPAEDCEDPYDLTMGVIYGVGGAFVSEFGIAGTLPFCGSGDGILPIDPLQAAVCKAELEAVLVGLTCGAI